ncbi:MAG: hypothetical protein HYT10_00920 [Candidatus Levybacteria bacterium]|nr:hypothetical protein [Candidatus Levybacteria bacterium]
MLEIIPGILEKEWSEIERKIELVLPFAKTIHIDLLDGKFVDNITLMDPEPFKKYTSEIFFEVHMMVEEPIQYLQSFADAGFKRFLGHIEKMSDISEFVAKGQLLGEVGLAIDGPTAFGKSPVPFEDVDCLLFYTSQQVGFSGPPFLPERLEKVKTARRLATENNLPFFPIEVDGGVNENTIVLAKDTGVTRFVTTSFLFRGNPKEQYTLLESLVKGE